MAKYESIANNHELLQAEKLREMAALYIRDKQIAASFTTGKLLDKNFFSSDEEYWQYEDIIYDYLDEEARARASGELYTAEYIESHPLPLAVVDRQWNELLGITSTNNLFTWFVHDYENASGAGLYSYRFKSNTLDPEEMLISRFMAIHPLLSEECCRVARERDAIDSYMVAASVISDEEAVDQVILHWQCNKTMSEAYMHIGVLAEEFGVEPWDLCR